MTTSFYASLVEKSLSEQGISVQEAERVLNDASLNLLQLLDAAYQVRKTYWQNDVTIHIINNAQNGWCPEDCAYCAQAKSSAADIEEYPLKSDQEILDEAKRAYESGAHRYCMVFAGRGPSERRVNKLAELIQSIKSKYPIEVCVSAGLVNEEAAKTLKAAGLDRLNHNLNTSEARYPEICTTHTYADRLATLNAAQKAGLSICSGMIAGMGEAPSEVVEIAFALRKREVSSIPVNFLIPIPGASLVLENTLTPQYCLRMLCMFRLVNPKAEIRVAAGREHHLRALQPLALYPASSLFMDGYLNTKGTNTLDTLQMIEDAGFKVRANADVEALLKTLKQENQTVITGPNTGPDSVVFKGLNDLRPFQALKS